MCGIAGIINNSSDRTVDPVVLKDMIDRLSHRGPDEKGFYIKDEIGLAQSRLSIIDLSGGKQPMFNEDGSICVVFNGEIFNYIEMREELRSKGHKLATHSDTEVIVHGYEEWGRDCFTHFTGQFAIAVWDANEKKLTLARDRVGIRPLFYSMLPGGTFIFASEMKAMFCYPGVTPEIDMHGIGQTFTFWVNIPPRTVFKNINELAPGSLMTVSEGRIKVHRYWKFSFPDEDGYEDRPLSYYIEGLKEKLYNATTIRLRADVPVAAYLSGGIDSSVITSLVKKYHNNDLITFSVAFSDAKFDERGYQMQMVDYLKTDHHIIEADYDNIGQAFSDVVYFSEKPLIRTAPAPLYILSGLVRSNNIKVVLTGEGSDEILGGYDIFKEDKVRRFWAKSPDSKWRANLLSSLYPDVAKDPRARRFWQSFFKKNLVDTDNKYYSHLIRWSNTSQIRNFFAGEHRNSVCDELLLSDLDAFVDPDIMRWHPLCRAQYLEATLFMSGYLLSSQGDRMMMGHSIEGRFPFLDHNVIEFANTIPPKYKLKVLNEKYILKKAYEDILPAPIVNRYKQPYRAPISQCFYRDNIASKMISREAIEKAGYFDSKATEGLLKKLFPEGKNVSEREDMTIVGIISMQLLHHHFIEKLI
ncbi:MAG: asparagine synthase (glutamine-hydrolyzing) [Spirochaetes bacterium]|nr:asparagine synthase (glutamine-hydrolyzing) [Spirochaetota bacterium]